MAKRKINLFTIFLLLNLTPLVLSDFWSRLRDKVVDLKIEDVQEQKDNLVRAIDDVHRDLKDKLGGNDDNTITETISIRPAPEPIIQPEPILPPAATPAPPPTQDPTPPSRPCIPSITVSKGKAMCKDDLIFEDNFENLNTEVWKRDMRIPLDSEDAEFVLYQNYPENCFVQDGKLHVYPKLLTDFPGFNELRLRTGQLNLGTYCTGTGIYECFRAAGLQYILPPVVSCKINTKNSFSFMYGKIEIRAKFPKGDWIFPQLFLEPLHNAYGSHGYASGQMRVGFIRGNEMLESKEHEQIDGYQLSGGIVLSPLHNLRSRWMKSTLSETHYGNDFHNYTLTWTNERISVAVDGITYANYRPTIFRREAQASNVVYTTLWNQGGTMAPFDKEFYLSLGVAVGGMSDFPDLSLNGVLGTLKPWNNTSPKSELTFWTNKDNWYPTWRDLEPAMKVEYVKVWAV